MKTVRVKISELEGPALDWAVAEVLQLPRIDGQPPLIRYWTNPDGWQESGTWNASEDWSQGGPLIEKFKVGVVYAGGYFDSRKWHATVVGAPTQVGVTPLIATMRAIVAVHTQADTVEVPADLLEAA